MGRVRVDLYGFIPMSRYNLNPTHEHELPTLSWLVTGVFVLNIILNNILLFSKINHILFNFFKFFLTKSNLVIRTLNSNNIRIQHPNGPYISWPITHSQQQWPFILGWPLGFLDLK
jgi:hypothetical protein